jgi:NhaP-type Na+/H+ or K+/H+ antiporter
MTRRRPGNARRRPARQNARRERARRTRTIVTAALTSDQLLAGIGLVLMLAVGAQVLAGVLRLPAIVVLLPVGFVAGILTKDVQPEPLLGGVFQPFVSVAVGVILFEAGLRLSLRDITPRVRPVVVRIVTVGALLTWLAVAGAVALLFGGLGTDVPLLIGAIVVVSGPTVVLPLLAFIRPTRDVRSLLKWEGVLIDPLGALLGVIVFEIAQTGGSSGWHPGELLANIGVGIGVGLVATGLLWWLVRQLQERAPRQVVPVTLALVVGALVASDLIRDDSGFVATLLMGMFLSNQRSIEVAPTVEFHETLVQLLIGVLFVMIAASVSPHAIESILPGALVLCAIMILVIRPAMVALVTWRSKLSGQERAFVGWMSPRGIVAGSTASAFALQLTALHIKGADKILPIVFVVIFVTVVVYGLSGALVARRLGVAGAAGTLVLIIGGHRAARSIGSALKAAGVAVRLWAGPSSEQAAARSAGLEVDQGRLLVDSLDREAELEEVTDALLLSASDDFNAMAAADLRGDLGHGHVYRVAPDPDRPGHLLDGGARDLFGRPELTLAELDRRLEAGGQIIGRPAGERGGDSPALDAIPLFVVGRNGELRRPEAGGSAAGEPGETVIELRG